MKTNVENYRLNKRIYVSEDESKYMRVNTIYGESEIVLALYQNNFAIGVSLDFEQARAIGTMLLYAAQEADNAKEDTA